MATRRDPETGLCLRGTSNGNERGSSEQRRRRKAWLVKTYRANVDVLVVRLPWLSAPATILPCNPGEQAALIREWEGRFDFERVPATRCFRCGVLLTAETVTADRIVPGCQKTKEFPRGGTYKRSNIRPACGPCNSETGGALAKAKIKKASKVRRGAADKRVTAKPTRALEVA